MLPCCRRGIYARHVELLLPPVQMAACHLGAPEAGETRGGHPTLPFVLVQGPPGTGKTHTVKVRPCHYAALVAVCHFCRQVGQGGLLGLKRGDEDVH
jgi:hypothetical protein